MQKELEVPFGSKRVGPAPLSVGSFSPFNKQETEDISIKKSFSALTVTILSDLDRPSTCMLTRAQSPAVPTAGIFYVADVGIWSQSLDMDPS